MKGNSKPFSSKHKSQAVVAHALNLITGQAESLCVQGHTREQPSVVTHTFNPSTNHRYLEICTDRQ